MPPRKVTTEEHAQIVAALRATRERRGLSIAAVDRLIAAAQGRGDSGAVRQIETGSSSPSVALLFDLARALDCSWTDLLGPPPSSNGDAEPEWEAGRRAGVGDSIAALRGLLDGEGS